MASPPAAVVACDTGPELGRGKTMRRFLDERSCVCCCRRGSPHGTPEWACALAANLVRTQLRGELQGRNVQRLVSHFVLDRFRVAPHFGSRSSSQLLSVRAPFPARFLSDRSPREKTSRASSGA